MDFLYCGALMALGGAILIGCATVGETGRKQLVLVSAEQEVQLGLESFAQVKKETPVSHDPPVNALVQKVGRRISAVADLPNAQWEFVVFENPEANAFCLPGGKVGVNTGLLPITKDEAGLATVIGHEVAHAYARHGNERLSRAMVIQGVSKVASNVVADSKYQQAVLTAYGAGSKYLGDLPFSRAEESEADHIGLRFMAKAGYDPEAAVAFWERFAAAHGSTNTAASSSSGSKLSGLVKSVQRYTRTHPLDEDRIRQIKSWLPEAKALYRPAP